MLEINSALVYSNPYTLLKCYSFQTPSMRPSQEIEETCKKLKPLIGNEADKLWYFYLAEDEHDRKDVALDIEIIAEKLLKQSPLEEKEILLEPPSEENSQGPFLVGDVIYNQDIIHRICLRHEDFIKQIGIFAITGEGKTNLAYLLALQLLKQKIPFIVIDWKRSWRNLLSLQDKIPELKEMHVYTVGREVLPFLWNPFRSPPGADQELWISTIAEALERSHLSGPGVAYYLNKIYIKLMKRLKNGFYPNFFDGLKEIESIRAFERELKWKQTALRILQSLTLGNAAGVFNKRSPIKLEQLLDKPVILELDLEMPKPLRIFFTEMILRWIHLYRMSQGETDVLRHVLFLEEAHNLFSENALSRNVSNCLENVYREIRSFGQGIVSITQHPSMLPVYLLGNCHTQIYLGLQHEDDIKTARKSLFIKPEEESYLNKLKVGECIMKIKNRIEPCHVRAPFVPIIKGMITNEWLKSNITEYLPKLSLDSTLNRKRYLPPDKYRVQASDADKKIDDGIKHSPHSLLIDILNNPFSSVTARYKTLSLNPKYGNKYKNDLVAQGLIKQQKITTSKGWITLFDITPRGRAILRDLGYSPSEATEGIVHKYWKDRIADFYKAQNFKVDVEMRCSPLSRPKTPWFKIVP